MKVVAVAITTDVDLHGDQISKEALLQVKEQIGGASCPAAGVGHDPTFHPLGWCYPRKSGSVRTAFTSYLALRKSSKGLRSLHYPMALRVSRQRAKAMGGPLSCLSLSSGLRFQLIRTALVVKEMQTDISKRSEPIVPATHLNQNCIFEKLFSLIQNWSLLSESLQQQCL